MTVTNEAVDRSVLAAFRSWGYLQADLDPLGRLPPAPHPELDAGGRGAELARRWYCGSIGVETAHIPDPEVRRWVYERMESGGTGDTGDTGDNEPESILGDLLRAELFEQVLQARYLGNKRFSLEGVTALVPLLHEILEEASARGTEQALLAMSHRGRLNVMANVVRRPLVELFAGFEDVDPRSVLGGGDVKYHLGATGTFRSRKGREIRLHLASNPSHLEVVVAVALGRVRAKQDRLGPGSEPRVLPVVLHGDSAFAGQGIVAELLNIASVDGYGVGGTVHVVVNNLIGFTTEPHAYTSTRYATDVAKRLPIPIFHVNGEDPEAVVRVARMAVDFRWDFGRDVVIDLIGYRRHGHSEVDDPTLTQPRLYAAIKRHPPLAELYRQRSGIDEAAGRELAATIRQELEAAQEAAQKLEQKPRMASAPGYWSEYSGGNWRPDLEVDTGVPGERLAKLGEQLALLPPGFTPNRKLERLLQQRVEMARGERALDFGAAETLAFATLLTEGVPVRLSGQDTRRGTFNQRHAVLVDAETESEHLPLAALGAEQAHFEVYDSALSEAGVLGFEYGYSRDYPETLVLWEAQFGDFANGAQIVIDQFLAAAEDKWGLLSGLVLLLPHGYEGQGPEHSSARVERFLQLAAEDNLQVCQPSSAGQYFHLLRRQALRHWRKPLVVFTPKSMLRHPAASSPVGELSRSRFLPVVDDPRVQGATRLVLCTGKVGHEIAAERDRRGMDNTAVAFLDQLYPFPERELVALLEAHPEARELVWAQEEPANQGALFYVLPRLERLSRGRHLRTVKRSRSASPATGSPKAHAMEQKTLIASALGWIGGPQ